MPSIFISYAHDDFEIEARKTSNYIKKYVDDSDVFLDRKKTAGGEWEETIRKAIGLCDIFIVVLTYAAVQSNAIETEVTLAKDKEKKIVPCKDDHLDKDWRDIPWNLGSFDNIEFDNGDTLRRQLAQKIDLIKELTSNEDTPIEHDSETKTQSPLDLAFSKPEKQLRSSKTKNQYFEKRRDQSWSFDDEIDSSIDDLKEIVPSNQIITLEGFPEPLQLSYSIDTGILSSATFNETSISITLEIEPDESGTLSITLPRLELDAKIGFDDDDYFVLIDGEEVEFSEESQMLSRVLKIPFKANNQAIEIIGTHFDKENSALDMLKDKKYEYRTKNSLQRRSGMSDIEFSTFLLKNKQVRKSNLPDKNGRELYQLKEFQINNLDF